MIIKLPFKYFLQVRLYKLPQRNEEGRFVSKTKIKKDRMTEQLRREQMPHWNDVKQKMKQKKV
jgi:hypothetical protein